MGDMKTLRDAFHARRLERGITQETAAHAARLTRKTVSDFENGRGSISAANLSRLLAAVGLELAAREASRRPILDELAQRYGGEDAPKAEPRPRARRSSR
jgi:transcriptional regulator with XRE-family HTH domain